MASAQLSSAAVEVNWPAQGADLELVLDGGESLPGHSVLLSLWSGVLSKALELPAGFSSCGSGVMRLPLPGTSADEWRTVMAFVYPVVPAPEVTWGNLATLLEVGNRYDMPAVLAKAAAFLSAHRAELTPGCEGQRFAWRWIALADRASLAAVVKDCIDAHVANSDVMRECSAELLAGLSPGTLVHLAIAQRDACHAAGTAAAHCGWCGQMRAVRRTCCYCSRSL